MTVTGKITGQSIGKNGAGAEDVRLLQVRLSDVDDIQEVEHFSQSGEDTSPAKGDKVLVELVGDSYKIIGNTKDLITPTSEEGEKKLYSQSGGLIKAFVNWLASGILELNGNADFAVRYNALETAFNQLQSDFDLHVHPGVTTGAGSTGAIAVGSTADITPAKITTVKVP